jgi:hypothetical protein
LNNADSCNPIPSAPDTSDDPLARMQGQPAAPFSQDSTKVGPKNGDRGGTNEAADGNPNTLAKTGARSIDVVFDLADLDQAQSLEDYRSAFGDAHTEVEPLEDEKVVLRLYGGGARRLL